LSTQKCEKRDEKMIVTVASFKGGQAKTTSAVHLAAFLQEDKPTLLVDGDPNRSATGWARRKGLPFRVIDERQAARYAREYEHIVIDTQARPTQEDLEALADGCDMLIIPVTPDALSLDALFLIVEALEHLGSNRFRILLTIVPPRPSKDGDEARATLEEAKLPVFRTIIRRFVAFQKAALQGVPVYEVLDPRAQEAWEDYRKVGEELLHEAAE
jgi:chromosome partitioning protein